MSISIIIPAYNEEEHIGKVLEKIPKKYEIIVVDDCSNDRTAEISKKHRVKVISNKKRRGKGYSIKRGVNESKGNFIVLMDGDFQFNPFEIKNFLKYKQYELVLGIRRNVPFIRKLTNKLSSIGVFLSTGIYLKDVLTGFRACKRELWEGMNLGFDDYRIDVEMVLKALEKKVSIKQIPVSVKYNKETSHITPRDNLKITNFLIKESVRKCINKL